MSTLSRAAVATPSRPAVARTAATLAVALLGLVLIVLGAPRAAAHNALVSSDPADGSTVATAPEQITLVFNEPAQELGSELVVTAPDGRAVGDGPVQLADTSVIQPLTGDLPAGTYTVSWRVTSADGHPIDGTLTFTAEAATTVGVDPGASAEPEVTTQATEDASPIAEPIDATPAPDAIAEDEDAGLAAGAIVAIVVGVLALAAVVTFVVHERRKAKADQDK
ncbi:copper resistance CopC family protein [Cellulomonas denverensis]|uniref:Copper resistance protein CopC n=1 Tax=Cellulomonas denverensis TaxID=264297 RepID=A0A7X6KW62_9CELL|nr:copper resistance CopC family protein [Cellulomonas denverensis]NKY23401.1 copper resistance protein CopC [Cellulomonas denverensis]